MDNSVSLLLTILNLKTNDISKIAVKFSSLNTLLINYKYYREPDVHEAYSKVFPRLNLGCGYVIVDMIEINDVIDSMCEKSILKEQIETAKESGLRESFEKEIVRLHSVKCECLLCKNKEMLK